ncbi:MarR family winged helix-turn-helix transcriptional regulator [Dactylosporangium sp. CA-092794]|uniref:MarR family winged helix-turn-helix transcriptional regulator n=1 Tax=Dactylosporangium sp. CA-092794 TaxID=3239929 RepID=UPI003D8E029E
MDHQALADALFAQLNGVRRVLRRRTRASLEQIGGPVRPELTPSQVELLRLVEAAPGTGVGAAAQGLHLAGNSVSTLVNQLTELGLLRRDRDPADRRSARLFLTPAAQSRLSAWRAARVSHLAAALAHLDPPDREQLTAAIPALSRLADILTTMDIPAASDAAGASPSPVAAPGTRKAADEAPPGPSSVTAASQRPAGDSLPSFLGNSTERDEREGAAR